MPFGAKGAILTALLASSLVVARFLISGIIPLERWRFGLINIVITTLPPSAAALIFHIGSGWPEFPLKLPIIGFGMCAAAMAVLFLYHMLPLIMERKRFLKQAVLEARGYAFSGGTLFAILGGLLTGLVLRFQPLALPAVVLLFVLERWLDWALYVGAPGEFYRELEAVSQTLESRDAYTERHSEGVAELTKELALRLGHGELAAEEMRIAALLHDIGKILTPDAILLKEGKLTPEERRTMEKHVENLRKVLGNPKFLDEKISWAECHHEWWDGNGYPKGLKGAEIPPAGRIMAVADVWNALTTDRPYRPGMAPEEAIKIIEDKRGTHFDPVVVDKSMKYLRERDAKMAEETAKAAGESGQMDVGVGVGHMGAAGAEAAGAS